MGADVQAELQALAIELSEIRTLEDIIRWYGDKADDASPALHALAGERMLAAGVADGRLTADEAKRWRSQYADDPRRLAGIAEALLEARQPNPHVATANTWTPELERAYESWAAGAKVA